MYEFFRYSLLDYYTHALPIVCQLVLRVEGMEPQSACRTYGIAHRLHDSVPTNQLARNLPGWGG